MGRLEQTLKALVRWADMRGGIDGPEWRDARDLIYDLDCCRTLEPVRPREAIDIPVEMLYQMGPWSAAQILEREA